MSALEISRPKLIVEKILFPLRMSQCFANGFCGSVSVLRGQAPPEVAPAGDVSVVPLANRAETASFSSQGSETMTGPQVGQIMDHLLDRVRFVLQSSGNRQAFSLMKETEDGASPRGTPLPVNQAQMKPCFRESGIRAQSFVR